MSERTVEDRARAMGWVPQEEFKGDEDRWVDADTFVDRGENIMPILKERLSKMENDLAERTAKLDKVTQNLTKFADFHKGTYKRAYEKALKSIEAKKLAAVEAGDTHAYLQAQQEEHDLQTEQDQLDETKGARQPVPEFLEFQRNNDWFNKDVAMTAFANHIAPGIAQTALNDPDFFAKIEAEVKREFPHKFLAKPNPNAVDAGGSGEGKGSSESGDKKWADLPKDAKDTYLQEFAEIPGFTKEQYAADYFAQ